MNTRASSVRNAAAKASSAEAPAETPTPATSPEPTAQPLATAALAGIDVGKYAGAGLEKAEAKDYAIPFLRALQTNSPECDETHAKFIPGAKPGMLINTVSRKLFETKRDANGAVLPGSGVLFVPCHYERRQLRWAPRGSGSQGFRGEVTEVEALKARETGKLVDHEGRSYFTEDGKVDDKKCDRLVDTRMHFGLLLDDDGVPHQVLLALVSTQIKKSKLFNSMQKERTNNLAGTVQPSPTFLHVYRVVTVKESNDSGSWFGVHFTLEATASNPTALVPNSAVYNAGAAFYEALKANTVKVDLAGSAEEGAGDAPAGDPDKF